MSSTTGRAGESILLSSLYVAKKSCQRGTQNWSQFFLKGPLLPTKFDFLLFWGILSHFSLVFSLVATHPKYTPGSLPILAHTQTETKRSTKAPEIKKDRYPTLGIKPAASTHRALQGDTCSSTPRRLYELEPKTKLWRWFRRTATHRLLAIDGVDIWYHQ